MEAATQEMPKKRPVGRPRRYVPAEQVRSLREQGLSFRQIALKTGCGYGTVRRAYFSQNERETEAPTLDKDFEAGR
jgi:DNA invertase Pin-like site-specific DNA recombinase